MNVKQKSCKEFHCLKVFILITVASINLILCLCSIFVAGRVLINFSSQCNTIKTSQSRNETKRRKTLNYQDIIQNTYNCTKRLLCHTLCCVACVQDPTIWSLICETACIVTIMYKVPCTISSIYNNISVKKGNG